jgi:hypothetical protein
MTSKLVSALLSVILLAFSAQAAQVPRSEKEIPIYPGAARDNKAETEAKADEEKYLIDEGIQYSDWDENPQILRSSSIRIFMAAAPAEEVLQFYLRELGGTEGDSSEHLYNGTTAAGKVSPVYYQIDFIDFSGNQSRDERQRKAELEKSRKPFKPGKWISHARFAWEVGEKNADVTNFELELDATGSKKIQTSIIVRKSTYMNPTDARKAQKKKQDEQERREDLARAKPSRKNAGSAFKPEDFKVPMYPGAQPATEITKLGKGSMATDEMYLYYRSDDHHLIVAEFYEKQPGFKVVHADKETAYLKRCREEYNRFTNSTIRTDCDVDITTQRPWMDVSTGKLMKSTLITIMRTKTEEDQ